MGYGPPFGSLNIESPFESRAGPGLHVEQLFYNQEDMILRGPERLVVTLDLIGVRFV